MLYVWVIKNKETILTNRRWDTDNSMFQPKMFFWGGTSEITNTNKEDRQTKTFECFGYISSLSLSLSLSFVDVVVVVILLCSFSNGVL